MDLTQKSDAEILTVVTPIMDNLMDVSTAIDYEKESEMPSPQNAKRSGYLFIAAGCMFFAAAYLGRQVAFCGVGVAFIAIGASFLARAKRT